MNREIASTARPTSLRLAGFVCVAAGAILAGFGATGRWAVIGFPGDPDPRLDVPIHGTDFWEGKVVLLGTAIALVALVVMRVAQSAAVRRSMAVAVIVIGAFTVALPLADAARANDRYGGRPGVDRQVAWLAAELELPEDVVREQLAEQFERALRIDIENGVWLTAAGGLLLVAGGVLSLAWARGRVVPWATGAEPDEPG